MLPSQMDTDITLKLKICNFKGKTYERGTKIFSQYVTKDGCEWQLAVCPNGDNESSTETTYISLYLRCGNSNKNDMVAKAYFHLGNKTKYFPPYEYTPGTHGQGFPDGFERQVVLSDYLEQDGSLSITCYVHTIRQWYPKEPPPQVYLQKLYQNRNSDTSDVSFLVDGKTFKAHKVILSLSSKGLYDIAKDAGNNDPIPIESMEGCIFESILEYVYTLGVPCPDEENNAKKLLVAADRFECLQLKLYTEYYIADALLAPENAAELFIFADSHSCAFLKEAASNMFFVDINVAKSTEAWSKVKESDRLVDDLVVGLSRAANAGKDKDPKKIDEMSVIDIFQELEEADLELDGNREILVSRLKAHRESKQAAKKQRID